MRPFVHCFRTRQHRYAYDVHSGEIVRVGEAVQALLGHDPERDAGPARRCAQRFGPQVIAQARESLAVAQGELGLFCSDRPAHRIVDYDESILARAIDQDLQVLTLGVTENCNLSCSYCVYSGRYPGRRVHARRSMPLAVARRAVDHLKAHNRPGKNPPGLGFYGGEPLLRFPLIRQVTAYARERFAGEPLGLTITTNGTVVSDEILEFLIGCDFHLVISLDGPQAQHDRERKFRNGRGSWDRVMRNVLRIKQGYPDYFAHRVKLSVTVAPPASYRELDELFSRIGGSYRIGLVEMATLEDHYRRRRVRDFEAVLDKFHRAAVRGELADAPRHPETAFVTDLFAEALRKIHRRNDRPARLDLPARHGLCIPGGFKLFVGADGTFYPCEKLEGYPSTRIGHVDSGVDVARVRGLFERFRELEWTDCDNCWIVKFCPCCFLHAFSEGDFSVEKRRVMCAMWRRHYHRMLAAYCSVLEENEDAFRYLETDAMALTATDRAASSLNRPGAIGSGPPSEGGKTTATGATSATAASRSRPCASVL